MRVVAVVKIGKMCMLWSFVENYKSIMSCAISFLKGVSFYCYFSSIVIVVIDK